MQELRCQQFLPSGVYEFLTSNGHNLSESIVRFPAGF